MDLEAVEIEPPFILHAGPKLQMEPWSRSDTEFEGAAEHDVARQKKFGAIRPFPSLAQLCFAQMLVLLPGEMAEAWVSSRGIGAQRANFAQIALTGSTRGPGTASRVLEAQNPDCR